jgi:Holliday junction resolvase RusA-like endonuclease
MCNSIQGYKQKYIYRREEIILKIEFFLPIKPPTKTHQEKSITVRKGKPVVYEDAELSAVREKFMAYIAPYKPQKPLDGPIRLLTKWCYPIVGKHQNGEYKTSKPDTDNIIKLLKDCLKNYGFFTKDDAQVASEITEKFWADQPGIYVLIEELM